MLSRTRVLQACKMPGKLKPQKCPFTPSLSKAKMPLTRSKASSGGGFDSFLKRDDLQIGLIICFVGGVRP
jgi:hypothetical protein